VEERLLYRRQVVEITLHRGERRLALGIAESRYYHRGENADDDDYGKHLDEGEPRADVLAVASHGGTLRRVPVAGTTSLRMSLLSRYVAVPKGTNARLVFRCPPVWSDTGIQHERDRVRSCALNWRVEISPYSGEALERPVDELPRFRVRDLQLLRESVRPLAVDRREVDGLRARTHLRRDGTDVDVEDQRGCLPVDVAARLECLHECIVAGQVRQQSQFDLGVVRGQQQRVGTRDEQSPNVTAER